MPFVTLPGGIRAHIKMAKPRQRRCSADGCRTPAGFQCDHDLGAGRTCDAHLCADHARQVGPDLHHCPRHHQQAGLFTGLPA